MELEGFFYSGQQRWLLTCIESFMLGNADMKKIVQLGGVRDPVCRIPLHCLQTRVVVCVSWTKVVFVDIFGWQGILLSLYLPVNFVNLSQGKTLCLGVIDPKLALLSSRVFLFRIGLWHHLRLDGSFVLRRHGCEIRFQRLAVICVYANDYPITLLLEYCLLLQATESGSGAEHGVSKKRPT